LLLESSTVTPKVPLFAVIATLPPDKLLSLVIILIPAAVFSNFKLAVWLEIKSIFVVSAATPLESTNLIVAVDWSTETSFWRVYLSPEISKPFAVLVICADPLAEISIVPVIGYSLLSVNSTSTVAVSLATDAETSTESIVVLWSGLICFHPPSSPDPV